MKDRKNKVKPLGPEEEESKEEDSREIDQSNFQLIKTPEDLLSDDSKLEDSDF